MLTDISNHEIGGDNVTLATLPLSNPADSLECDTAELGEDLETHKGKNERITAK